MRGGEYVCGGVGLLGGALSLVRGVAECKDDGTLVVLSHGAQNSLGERTSDSCHACSTATHGKLYSCHACSTATHDKLYSCNACSTATHCKLYPVVNPSRSPT